MLQRLVVLVVLAVLGVFPACAETSTHTAQQANTWAEFDRLVADAKKTTMVDPNAGLIKARAAIAYAEHQPNTPQQQQALATGLWLEAEALTRTNQVAAAHAVLARAIKIASNDSKVTSLDGNLALSLARVAHADGDIALSLKSYQQAHDIFLKIGQTRGQSTALQGLGTIYDQAHDFDREINYYSMASQVYSSEPSFQLSIANNLGFALQQAGRYQEALTNFRKALAAAKTLQSPFLQARILANIAAVNAKLHNYPAALAAANQALTLLGKNDENNWAPIVWGVKAQIEFDRGRLSPALADIERAFRGVDLTKTIATFRDFHEAAYKIYRAAGNYPQALAHLEAFKRLDDDGRKLTASTNLALMSARFDFANQKLEIERLKTEQLQREASIREARAANQRLAFLTTLAGVLIFLIWLSRRHQLLRRHRDVISKANEELKRILGERDLEIVRRVETESQLRVAMAAAEQANRAKTMFLANMSHELRTPLNAIIGFSEIIASGIMSAAKSAEYSADINASGRKLLVILNDILETANLDAGSVTLTEGEVALDQVIQEALNKARKDAEGSQKQIVVSGETGLRLKGDGPRLTQVLDKLLSNAIKFTAPDGRISVCVQNATDGGVEITIADNGIGIPAEQLHNIMERFGQIENAYARTHGGIGLGLPIAKSLVMLHGGTLSLQSEVDKGATVRVHLPPDRRLPHNSSAKHSAVA